MKTNFDLQYINLRMKYVTHISARGACISQKLKGHYGVNMERLALAIHLSFTLVYCLWARHDAVANLCDNCPVQPAIIR